MNISLISGAPELDDASFAKVYSIDQNPGYTKEIIKDGDFTFTVFKEALLRTVFIPTFSAIVNTQENEALT